MFFQSAITNPSPWYIHFPFLNQLLYFVRHFLYNLLYYPRAMDDPGWSDQTMKEHFM
jgi:hypothetical protein